MDICQIQERMWPGQTRGNPTRNKAPRTTNVKKGAAEQPIRGHCCGHSLVAVGYQEGAYPARGGLYSFLFLWFLTSVS